MVVFQFRNAGWFLELWAKFVGACSGTLLKPLEAVDQLESRSAINCSVVLFSAPWVTLKEDTEPKLLAVCVYGYKWMLCSIDLTHTEVCIRLGGGKHLIVFTEDIPVLWPSAFNILNQLTLTHDHNKRYAPGNIPNIIPNKSNGY